MTTSTGVIASDDQRELPVEDEQHDGHRDDREHVLEEEDQAVAEEEAHALQVDRRARHQLAGLVAVVEAEREAHAGARRARGACRTRRRAPGGRRSGGGRPSAPRARTRPRARRRRASRASGDRVSRAPCRSRPRSARRARSRALRADGEHDRDDQRELVRAQEAEQPGERVAITRDLLHPRNLAIRLVAMDSSELAVDELHRGASAFPVRHDVHPRARAGRVRERDRDGAVALERGADAALQVCEAEQLPDREPADRDDQRRPDQPQLPVAPEGAELLLSRVGVRSPRPESLPG